MKRLATQEMDTPSARQPLPISVTAAGQDSLTLTALLRQVIPILQQPDRVSEVERLQLAQSLTLALEQTEEASEENPSSASPFIDEEIPPDTEYEPGLYLDWEGEEQ